MTVALFTHRACLAHNMGEGHPESPDRLRVVLQALEHPDFVALLREEASIAAREDLLRAHPASYIDHMMGLNPGPDELIALDGDTLVGPGSIEAALRAAGGAVAAVEAVHAGWAKRAFVATRPPGHHAEPAQSMGFCLFGNAAIAALVARDRLGFNRIAVVDFDVHHGNGTAAILAGQPKMFYASSHQFPCYPGTAGVLSIRDDGVDLPLAPGAKSDAFRAAYLEILLPAVDRFAPDLLIISAGFDAHKADPLAQLRLETADFTWVTEQLMAIADRHAGGRIVSLLEGGYDLTALAASAAAHVRALLRIAA